MPVTKSPHRRDIPPSPRPIHCSNSAPACHHPPWRASIHPPKTRHTSWLSQNPPRLFLPPAPPPRTFFDTHPPPSLPPVRPPAPHWLFATISSPPPLHPRPTEPVFPPPSPPHPHR